MRRPIKGREILGVFALFLTIYSAQATLVPGLSFEQLTDSSEMVISGTVVRSWTDWDSAHRFIWTHNEISVTGSHKGSPSRTLVVSEPGGVVGDRAMSISGAVSYLQGERVVLFLQRMPNGYLRTTGWSQGKYTVDAAGLVHTSGSGGLEIMQPDGRGAPAKAAATPLRSFDGMSIVEFRARVEARVRSAKQGGLQ